MSSDQGLRSALRESVAVIYDFDGPVCDVFAGFPAESVARQLEQTVGVHFETDDPLEVLRSVCTLRPAMVKLIEYQLISAEIQAVETARVTEGGLRSMQALSSRGKVVGILSNNSGEAVFKFMKRMASCQSLGPVVGRPFGRPDLMKPNPYGLDQVLDGLGARARDVVFVGDSKSDIEVAETRGVRSVGFANKPGKKKLLANAGAEFVVESMVELEGW